MVDADSESIQIALEWGQYEICAVLRISVLIFFRQMGKCSRHANHGASLVHCSMYSTRCSPRQIACGYFPFRKNDQRSLELRQAMCIRSPHPEKDPYEELGYTRIHHAVLNFDIAKLDQDLTTSDAEIDSQDVQGRTPLYLACMYSAPRRCS